MNIRKAKIKDLSDMDKIDTLGSQLNRYSGLDKLKTNLKSDTANKYYRKFVYGKKKWAYVAEDNKNIVGFILFNIEKRPSYYRFDTVGYIDLVVVAKKHRGKGISRLLMEKAYEVFKKQGIKYLKLTAHIENPAHKVWKKHGFKDYNTDMWKKI